MKGLLGMDACSKAELRGVDAAGRSGIRQGRQGRIIPRNSRLEFQAAVLEDFETSAERRDRLRLLVDAAHGLGLEAEAPTIPAISTPPAPFAPAPLSRSLCLSLLGGGRRRAADIEAAARAEPSSTALSRSRGERSAGWQRAKGGAWRATTDSEFQVRDRVRWLLSCGFDHLGTELGSTEFTRGRESRKSRSRQFFVWVPP